MQEHPWAREIRITPKSNISIMQIGKQFNKDYVNGSFYLVSLF
jgi:hypothetical protein